MSDIRRHGRASVKLRRCSCHLTRQPRSIKLNSLPQIHVAAAIVDTVPTTMADVSMPAMPVAKTSDKMATIRVRVTSGTTSQTYVLPLNRGVLHTHHRADGTLAFTPLPPAYTDRMVGHTLEQSRAVYLLDDPHISTQPGTLLRDPRSGVLLSPLYVVDDGKAAQATIAFHSSPSKRPLSCGSQVMTGGRRRTFVIDEVYVSLAGGVGIASTDMPNRTLELVALKVKTRSVDD